ncbi:MULTISPECIES: hypothetical protein [Kamptonema]|uniref:hypothetical protein n=1 Tax=Kamptonema TaxID=1501433 RepID=UPI000315A587|nr:MULTISPECIES: hypothetical protein [Kamptonema]
MTERDSVFGELTRAAALTVEAFAIFGPHRTARSPLPTPSSSSPDCQESKST